MEVSKLERTRCGRFWLTFTVGFVLVVCLVSLMACRALTPLARRGWRPISTWEKWRVRKVRIKIQKNIWRKFENPRSRQSEVSENVLPSWRMLIDQISMWRNVLRSKTDSLAEVFLFCASWATNLRDPPPKVCIVTKLRSDWSVMTSTSWCALN